MTTTDAAARIYEHLSQREPSSVDEIGLWAADEGMTKARNPATYVKDKIRHDRRFVCGDDGRWTTVARVLEGRWFTHRIRHDEVKVEALSDELDLGPVYRAVGVERTYTYAWERRHEVLALRSTLSGPFHWLPELTPGDVVGLRFDHGRLDVERIAEPVRTLDGARLAQDLRRSFERMPDFSHRFSSHTVTERVIQSLASQPDLLREPTLPLSELVPELDRPSLSDLIDSPNGCDFFDIEDDGCWRCRRQATGVVRVEVPASVLFDAERAAGLQDSSLADLLRGAVDGLLASLTGQPAGEMNVRQRSAAARGWD